MDKLRTTPRADGFRMPAEYELHEGCMMIWPERPGSWIYGAKAAQYAFCKVAFAIAESERVFMLASHEAFGQAEEMISQIAAQLHTNFPIEVIEIENDDAWARDVGPTFVINDHGERRGIDWQFNAWGGEFDGLYADWKKDNAVAQNFLEICEIDGYDAQHFVLEGGSIHVDGEGTALVTEACLLSKGRNPQMTKEQIEEQLRQYLNIEKVIWLPHGIYQDETNEHIDNVCAFVKPGEVVLAWTDDKTDPQYPLSNEDLQILEQETDAKGRNIKVHKLLIPETPVTLTQKECDGFAFEEGEDIREAGERMAASYVNFYISNGGIILPQFGDTNDQKAVDLLSTLFPTRKVIPIAARDIIVGGGNIHCITQQIPLAVDKD